MLPVHVCIHMCMYVCMHEYMYVQPACVPKEYGQDGAQELGGHFPGCVLGLMRACVIYVNMTCCTYTENYYYIDTYLYARATYDIRVPVWLG
jgi:hypothetical protein